jgi:hypothetical protein
VEEKKAIAQEVINTLGIAPLVRSIVIEKGDTPWSEKELIKWSIYVDSRMDRQVIENFYDRS